MADRAKLAALGPLVERAPAKAGTFLAAQGPASFPHGLSLVAAVRFDLGERPKRRSPGSRFRSRS
jgi:hypothetical protein